VGPLSLYWNVPQTCCYVTLTHSEMCLCMCVSVKSLNSVSYLKTILFTDSFDSLLIQTSDLALIEKQNLEFSLSGAHHSTLSRGSLRRHVSAFYVPLINLSSDFGSCFVLFLAVCRTYLGYWLSLFRELGSALKYIKSTARITRRSCVEHSFVFAGEVSPAQGGAGVKTLVPLCAQ